MSWQELIQNHENWGNSLYEDGVFTYTAKRKSHYHKAFKRLEREEGIDFKRVKKAKRADIICDYNMSDYPKYAGVCRYTWGDGPRGTRRAQNHLSVQPGRWFTQSTVVHEIGHALGLGHPKDHSRDDTIMSYGAPGDLPWFTEIDLQALDYLY